MGALEAGFALIALSTCLQAAGFELSTRRLGNRPSSSQTATVTALALHFVAENGPSCPVWSLHITAVVAQ